MPESPTASPSSLEQSFDEYERPIRIRNYKVGCVLAGFFMPAGASLDYFSKGAAAMSKLLPNRLMCTGLLAVVFYCLHVYPSSRYYRYFGMMVALLPLLSISWMIYSLDGAVSSYYAGLTLIMLGSAILLRWSFADSILIFILTLAAYMAASLLHGDIADGGMFFNNIYFLVVTGVFIVAGSWHYNAIRKSEFLLRHRLDLNRAKLEATNQKLREMDEIKNRFFANISHELRTPLTLLIAPLESLINNPADVAPDQQSYLLSTMHSNGMRLLKLINDLLDLVRLESGRVQVNRVRVELDAFVRGLSNSVHAVAKDKRITLDTMVQPNLGTVMLDPDKLERICLNLLFNAVKFTAARGVIRFRAMKVGQWLEFEVEDSGMGIEPEHLAHIFDRFWQADTSSQRKFQGMGIGLALVKELAEAQGGSVSAASEVGRGTTMTVKLPFEAAGEEEEDSDDGHHSTDIGSIEPMSEGNQEYIGQLYRRAELFPAIPSLQSSMRPIETNISRSKKMKLLIADDEPDMLGFLKSQLKDYFEILEAVDGQQAVDKAAQFLPDIILSDMMMPEKDGLQVCRELRERTSTRSIPVVLLTARADEKTKMDCLQAGASDFLSKPFSMTEICVRLKNLADSRRFQKDLAEQKQQLESAMEQLKETETMLVRNEKLAALGRLSAGLIHEINNPLNYSRQGLYILRESGQHLPEEERADFADTLKDVEDGVNRVVRIISDLRGFTRMTNETNQVFELKPVVETAMRFFSHEWKDGVKLEINVPSGLEMRGDSNHLVQVLINLVQNAIDAMRGKTYPEGEGPLITISAEPEVSLVRLIIRDNGPGVPEDIRDKVFDPFFTTKDVGAGMGLGLAICHRIIAEHGGRVDIRSETGVYSEFILEFPSTNSIFHYPEATETEDF